MTHGGLHPWVRVSVSDGTISTTGGVLVGTLRRELQSLALTPSPCPSRHRAKEVPQPSTGEVEVVVYGFGQLRQDANDGLAYLRDVDRSPNTISAYTGRPVGSSTWSSTQRRRWREPAPPCWRISSRILRTELWLVHARGTQHGRRVDHGGDGVLPSGSSGRVGGAGVRRLVLREHVLGGGAAGTERGGGPS